MRVLGEQAVVDAGGRAVTRSARSIALIGYLAWHAGVPQQRSLIAGAFWPESTSAQALTNLRRELHALRALLPGGSLKVAGTAISWEDSPECSVDVRLFSRAHARAMARTATARQVVEHGQAAVEAYRGDFLPGAYDDWVLETRETLRHQAVEVLVRTMAAARSLRGYDVAIQLARRRIALEPLEETGYRDLMRLQSESGDRAGAVSTYHHCASVLERQLGIPPDPATNEELHRALGDLNQPGRRVERRARAGSADAQLVGRGATMEELVSCWETVKADRRPRVVVVQGRAGVGKTRLATEFEGIVRSQGELTASAQCFGAAGRVALAPVADWLRAPAVARALGGLDDVWRVEVDRLLPITSTAPAAATERALVDAWQRHRFLEGIARAFLAVDSPLVLVLDNAQWCDEETLGFLSFLTGLASGHRLMLLATLREEGQREPSAVTEWTTRLAAADLLTTIELDPLQPPEISVLATALSGKEPDEAALDVLLSATGGYPLYVVEAMRSGFGSSTGSPSDGWADVLRLRLRQTSSEAREIAGLASAVGRDFSLDLLAEASDLDADSVVHAVDELWRARLVREVGSGYDFSHDLLRDVAYESVSPPRRWLLHRRLAQALELLNTGDPEAVATQLAEQYDRGGQSERAVPYYRMAAASAAGRFANAEALRLSRRALRLVESLPASPRRDARELDCLRSMAAPLNALEGYSSPALKSVLERVVRLSEESHLDETLVSGLVGLWGCRFVQGDIKASYEIANRALSIPVPDAQLVGQAHFAVAGSAMTRGWLSESIEHFASAYGDGVGTESLMVGTIPGIHARAWAAHALLLAGDREGARDARHEAIDLGRAAGHPYSLAVALAYAAITDQLRGDREALVDSVGELRELTRRYDFAYYGEWGLVLEGWLRGGPPGISLAREGIENLRRQGSLARMPYWLDLLAELYLAAGRPERTRAVTDAARVAAETSGDVWWLPEVLRHAAAMAEPEAAARLRRTGRELAEEQGSAELLERYER